MKTIVWALALCFAFANIANADVVDSLDFSTDGQGSTHDTSGSDPIESSPISGGTAPNDWTLTFDPGLVSSDGSTNEFITSGGVMRVQDWGGDGTVTGNWVASGDGTIDVIGAALTIGADSFNFVGTEGITWFYAINGGTATTLYLGESELGGPVAEGTDVGNTFSDIVVASGDSIDYGFTVNVNGAGDGVEISSVTVDFTAIPEPATATLFGLAGLGLCVIRRRS